MRKHPLLTIVLLSCFILFSSINPSLANFNSKSPCSYPTHTIKCFIPQTITFYIFSSSPNPSLKYFSTPTNNLYSFPQNPFPSSSITHIPSQIHQKLLYLTDTKRKFNQQIKNKQNANQVTDNDYTHYNYTSIESTESNIQLYKNKYEYKYKDKLSKIQNNLINLSIYMESLLNTLTDFSIKCMIQLRQYKYNRKFEQIIRGMYGIILNIRLFIINYTNNECNNIMPYLLYILPFELNDPIAMQQICSILLFGSIITIGLIISFIGTWVRYKNIINKYAKHM